MLTSSHWGTYSVAKAADETLTVTPFSGDPAPSAIGDSFVGALDDNLRIAQPMVRSSWLESQDKAGPQRQRRGLDAFVPIQWPEALELVAETLKRVIAEHGNSAIFGGSYGWASAGRFHHAQSQLHRFLNVLGGYTGSVNTYSSGAAEVIVPHVLGYDYRTCNDATTTWNVLARHTELLVAFGGLASKNSQVHPGGISHHLAPEWLSTCVQNGMSLVNVSPLQSDTDAELSAQWLPIRPNTDTALMLALSHTLVVEELVDASFVQQHCVGFEAVRDYLLGTKDGIPKTPDWAAVLTGIAAPAIINLARQMAIQRTFITLSLSIQRGDHGEQTYWAGITLAALLGQIGLPGGGIGFGYSALGGVGNPRSSTPGPTFPQGQNPTNSFIPVARLTDMLLAPGARFNYNGQELSYPDIKLIYWAGGNPFHHQQDLARLTKAWREPQTVIAHEIWWNPLARHADIVLPATTTLERNDIGFNSADAHMIAMQQARAPVQQARSDFAIFRGIAEKMGCFDAFTENRDEKEWLQFIYENYRERHTAELPEFSEFWATGSAEIAPAESETVFLADFRANPNTHPLPTPSGKIELFSNTIAGFEYDDAPGQAIWLAPAEWLSAEATQRFPLHLLSNQPGNRLHSQFDQGKASQAGKVAGREGIFIHPEDAATRGIEAGTLVRIFNDRGACLAGAILSTDLQPGVVMLPTGAWFDPEYSSNGEILYDRAGNPNMLTLDKGTSKLAQATSAQTALVEVERFTGQAKANQSYQLPTITNDQSEANGL